MKAACVWRNISGYVAVATVVSGGLLSGGCELLKAPDPEATPVPPPTPRPGIFVPADGNEATQPPVRLNVPNDPSKPSHYELVNVAADTRQNAILLSLRAVKIENGVTRKGAPSLMRLAGIKGPVSGPGSAQLFKTIRDWTLGQQLDVDQDKKYPTDLQDRPRIQVFFKGRSGPTKGTSLLLNRMLVRSGYAVVNIFEPTSLDSKSWSYDEQHARTYWNPVTKLPGLGLWALTPSPLVKIGQRIPSPRPTVAPKAAPAAGAAAQPGAQSPQPGVTVNNDAIKGSQPANRPIN